MTGATSKSAAVRSRAGSGAATGAFAGAQLAAFGALSRRQTGWLAERRAEAFARFSATGIPTTRDEAWRFTSLAPIERIAFTPPQAGTGEASASGTIRAVADAASLSLPHRLVLVNGRLAPELSSAIPLPRGVKLEGLAQALGSCRGLIEAHLGRQATIEQGPFAALNLAFFEDGALLYVPDGVALEEPILIVHLSVPGPTPSISHPRLLVVLGRGSEASVLESHAGVAAAGEATFTNTVTELVLGEGAVLDHVKLQDERAEAFHIGAIGASVGRTSTLTAHSIDLGGGLVRNDVYAALAGEGASCTLNGLFLTSGKRHIDNHTFIDHALPHGTSRELYKGILDGDSRGVFDGRIVVRQDAQKTDARQVNRNLLLSDGSLINTKPQLEIHADDVKCAHAATIGRLDEVALFYLRSRGLSVVQARGILIRAFADEVTSLLRLAPVRALAEERVGRLITGDAPLGPTS